MKKITTLIGLLAFTIGGILAQSALSSDIKVDVKNEQTINSGSLEYSPAFYENGIVFISDSKIPDKDGLLDQRINKHTMSIFLSRRNEEGVLQKGTSFAKEITTKFHEGPLTFNRTNDQIFFTRNNYIGGQTTPATDGIIKLTILTAKLVGGTWTEIQELSIDQNDYDYAHPSINVDNNKLYFASNRPGGFGGMDLWVVEKNGDAWGTPANLGPNINSSAHEIFPFIHADGTLFYSSNGHNSMGGLDIFFSKELDGSYVVPVNLGERFNTASDDLSFIIDRDKRNGYFASNREGGKGQDDIYSFFIDEALGEDIFQLPPDHPAIIASNNGNNDNEGGFGNNKITLFVADRLTGAEIVGATVEYVDLEQLTSTEVVTDQEGNVIQLRSANNGEVVTLSTEESAISGLTDIDGAYQLMLGEGNYLINITKDGYRPKQVMISGTDGREEIMVLMDKANNCATINGLVIYTNNDPVPGAQITIKEEGELTMRDVTADANGTFGLCLECGKSYVITATKNGRATSRNLRISADCNNGLAQDLTLSIDGGGLVAGTVIRLSRIYYNFNDASIRPDARDELNTLVSILKNYPTLEIEIASHTDSRGTHSYNDQLSQRRADKVVAYLVRNGIDAGRLYPVGYGERELLNHCTDGVTCTELDHQYNRRTEVRVREMANPIQVEYVANPPESIDPAPSSVTSGGYGGSGSRYYVIAGTFNIRSNADNRLFRIQQLGFEDAKIIRGSASARNAVMVRAFSSYSQARTLADEIENVHNIHTYVKRGR